MISMDYVSLLERYCTSSIRLNICAEASQSVRASHFGGKPDVPQDFQWPVYKNMPLTFMLQLSCREIAPYDINHELPEYGLLSFFYALDNECFGYDNRDKDGFRVFWFDDSAPLSVSEFPVGVPEKYMLPSIDITFEREVTYPHIEDFSILIDTNDYDYSQFESAEHLLGIDHSANNHRILGWSDLIQNNNSWHCELLSKGYSLGAEYMKIPERIRNASKIPSVHRWKLLLQLGTVQKDGYRLMFGDAGRLYFYISDEDLKARRFDRVYGEMQCY